MINIIKRSGEAVPLDLDKIRDGVYKASQRAKPKNLDLADIVAEKVSLRVYDGILVTEVQDLVENALMDSGEYDTAREYITYRFSHKPSIFNKRVNLKPYEYPTLLEYVDAIRHSYWVHTEFNFNSDVQDYHTSLTKWERQVVKRAMLAISQIEVSVKTFWAKISDTLPKPEVAAVGMTFAESEVRHADAYSNLLEILGLNEEFKNIQQVPAIARRIGVLEKALGKPENEADFIKNVLLFSTLIENASLFSQFYIMMYFNKEYNKLKGISNAVQATSKEEDIHARFGIELVNIIKSEQPLLFEEASDSVMTMVHEFLEAEWEVLNWIFEGTEAEDSLHYLKYQAYDLVCYRLDTSLAQVGLKLSSEYTDYNKESFQWFLDETLVSSNVDFFYKKSTSYSKGNKSFEADDLF